MDVLTWARAQWDRILGFTLVAVGAVALVIGYEKAADTRYLAEQITVLISGGLGGIFCLGAGATLLVCADIRDEWRKLDRIETILLHMSDTLGLPPPPERRAGRPGAPTGEAVSGRGAGPGQSKGNGAESRLAGRALATPVAILALAGLGLVVAGWQASASTTRGSAALGAAGWSAAGIVVAGLGAAALIVTLKRTVRLRQSAILSPVALYGAWQDAGLRMALSPAAAPEAPAATVRYGAGLRHFHRPGCAALAGQDSDSCDREAAAARLDPCPLCEP